jgi:DNA-binding response OmpR family regulator
MNHILNNKTILVVEDDWKNRELIISSIHKDCKLCKLVSASNGEEALTILSSYNIDLVILDLEMPVLDGIETLKKIKNNASTKETPVIIYTGVLTDTEYLKKTLDLGAVDFLRKPTEPVEIIARISSAIRQKQFSDEKLKLADYNSDLEQQILKNKIIEINNQLKNQMLLLAQKNEVLLKLKEQLTDNPNSINNIHRIIQTALVEQNYWNEFLEQFNKTEPGFIKLLQTKYPQLTINEIRLCSLIRIGIENKAISSILQVSPSAIEKARYRIRKKINLSPQTSLDKAIFEIK